ncbi:hypothetical protein TRAPUB_11886 [Trametes pubescens]|uniref:Uncharacterized protein n=1 Tax=Trametes pubescens TaxID=154538 RepID=A0A1M2VVF3_TRAPU|nr:hypothetical protein TRAPUB_11886 [Trametes pubescens]
MWFSETATKREWGRLSRERTTTARTHEANYAALRALDWSWMEAASAALIHCSLCRAQKYPVRVDRDQPLWLSETAAQDEWARVLRERATTARTHEVIHGAFRALECSWRAHEANHAALRALDWSWTMIACVDSRVWSCDLPMPEGHCRVKTVRRCWRKPEMIVVV